MNLNLDTFGPIQTKFSTHELKQSTGVNLYVVKPIHKTFQLSLTEKKNIRPFEHS